MERNIDFLGVIVRLLIGMALVIVGTIMRTNTVMIIGVILFVIAIVGLDPFKMLFDNRRKHD